MKTLSTKSKEYIKLLFKDEQFIALLIDSRTKELYRHVQIKDDGSIILGKSSFNWINQLFGDYKVIAFADVTRGMIQILSGPANARNERNFAGLSKNFMENWFRKDNPNDIIDAIFSTYILNYDGAFSSDFVSIKGVKEQNKSNAGTTLEGYVAVQFDDGVSLIDLKSIKNSSTWHR